MVEQAPAEYDVCIVGSGAGGGIAHALEEAGAGRWSMRIAPAR